MKHRAVDSQVRMKHEVGKQGTYSRRATWTLNRPPRECTEAVAIVSSFIDDIRDMIDAVDAAAHFVQPTPQGGSLYQVRYNGISGSTNGLSTEIRITAKAGSVRSTGVSPGKDWPGQSIRYPRC